MSTIDNLKVRIEHLKYILNGFGSRSQANEHDLVFVEPAYKMQSKMQMGVAISIACSLMSIFAFQISMLPLFKGILYGSLTLSVFYTIGFLLLLDPKPWTTTLLMRSKLLFSKWGIKDVEDAIARQDFTHPAMVKLDKNFLLLQPLSQQQINQHHEFFVNLPDSDQCRTIWTKMLARPQGHPIRQMDVDALSELHQKLHELDDLNQKEASSKVISPQDLQFDQRRQLVDTSSPSTTEVDEVTVDQPQDSVDDTVQVVSQQLKL